METLSPLQRDADLVQDFQVIRTVAREAGELARRYFHRSYETWDKSPGNPVSEADLAVDAFIKERLRGKRPHYGWLSEETADAPTRLDCRRVWVVDPIDGTKAFVAGEDGFAVSIALVEDGKPILACLYAPLRNQFFSAAQGEGATLNGVQISVSPSDRLTNCRMLADKALFTADFWPTPWPPMWLDKPNSIALRIALVAAGLADAAVALRPKCEWDLAAALLVLQEAGGVCTDHLGEHPRFNQPDPIYPAVVAASAELYPQVLARVAAGVAAWQVRTGQKTIP